MALKPTGLMRENISSYVEEAIEEALNPPGRLDCMFRTTTAVTVSFVCEDSIRDTNVWNL